MPLLSEQMAEIIAELHYGFGQLAEIKEQMRDANTLYLLDILMLLTEESGIFPYLRSLRAWTVASLFDFLPEAMQAEVQPLITKIARQGLEPLNGGQ